MKHMMAGTSGLISGILYESYLYDNYIWALSLADPRVGDWPFMSSPLPTIALILLYLSCVWLGPQLMVSRRPFQLKWILVFYNLAVMLLNLYIGCELLYCALYQKYSWLCQLVDTSLNTHEVRIAKALWWYYFSKCIEFLDTIFFILRKKNRQLTFLHVYHHSTMFGLWWIGVKWVPGGSAVPGAMANCFVHVLMYFYYALSAFGPTLKPYLCWKKYITIIQLAQFTAAMSLGIYAIVTNCPFTRWMEYAFVAYTFSFIILFGDFYRKNYKRAQVASANKDKYIPNDFDLKKKKGLVENALFLSGNNNSKKPYGE
ncbi:very long chain fatty acid elongase 4-like isoform X1 [Tachypleus tridentatus]|uniref:very long chain fatty acid elongase 4-like isoform X1 n=2 Tax=Tachypleus tridentatus TaxID=6853 RepID=UPI003FD18378